MPKYTVYVIDYISVAMEVEATDPEAAANHEDIDTPSTCDRRSEVQGSPWVSVMDESGEEVYSDGLQHILFEEINKLKAECAELRERVSHE